MIWFGKHPYFPQLPVAGSVRGGDHERMESALRWVAARAPGLSGGALIEALASTGWVDERTARRLLPRFRHFDADRYFAESLRALSFRGRSAGAEFRARVAVVAGELAGSASLTHVGEQEAIRFRHGDHEGTVLAYPEVALSVGGEVYDAIAAAAEEMPDTLVVVARNFAPSTAAQLSGMLTRTGVPGTLVTVNLLLGIRAMTLRYQPEAARVLDLLAAGRPLRSADVARLGDRVGV
jgi:hypothetical protein